MEFCLVFEHNQFYIRFPEVIPCIIHVDSLNCNIRMLVAQRQYSYENSAEREENAQGYGTVGQSIYAQKIRIMDTKASCCGEIALLTADVRNVPRMAYSCTEGRFSRKVGLSRALFGSRF